MRHISTQHHKTYWHGKTGNTATSSLPKLTAGQQVLTGKGMLHRGGTSSWQFFYLWWPLQITCAT
jgi:hypothetical protein